MKKLLFIIILINAFFILKAQDQYPYQLPEYTAVVNDSTDVLYIDDSKVDKHIKMPTLIQLVSDSTNQLRGELADTAAQLRSEISGGGAWAVTGDMIDLVSADDSVYVGDGSATEKFEVDGNAVVDTMKPVAIKFTPNILIYYSGDDMYFDDNSNDATALSGLIGGSSYFSKTGTTLYMTTTTDNQNIGGNTATTYKQKITGSQNVTGDIYLEDQLGVGTTPNASYDVTIDGSRSGIYINNNGPYGLNITNLTEIGQYTSSTTGIASQGTATTGKVFQGVVSGTGTMFDANANSGTNVTYYLARSNTDTVLSVRNDTIQFPYFDLATTDTVALLLKGFYEQLDTASLVAASKAWTDKIPFFKRFFSKSKQAKALPLPYPNGTERREMNAMYSSYQIEYTLETLTIYINRLWNWLFVLSGIILVLIVYIFVRKKK